MGHVSLVYIHDGICGTKDELSKICHFRGLKLAKKKPIGSPNR